MLGNDTLSVSFFTIYLLAYCILLQFEAAFAYAFGMLLFLPVILVWFVFTLLKHGKYTGPELGEAEFGYLDKDKKSLGTF